MISWTYSNLPNSSPSISGYEAGTEFVWPMTLTNDSDGLMNAYLAVADQQFEGVISARRSGSTAWVDLAGLGDSDCWLGYVPTGGTDIEFRLLTEQSDYIGPLTIQVYLLYGDGSVPPMPLMLSAWRSECYFWADCWDCVFWADDYFLSDTPCITVSDLGFGPDTGVEGQFTDDTGVSQWSQ